MRFSVVAACPEGYEFPPNVQMDLNAKRIGSQGDGRLKGNRRHELPRIEIVRDPLEAVRDADIVVTDTWISMGQAHAETKLAAMMPFQVTEALMAQAKPGAKFLHCLPAHRGEEVVDAVIDGPQSLIWQEAENRLHAQKAVLRWCFGQIG